MPTWGGGGTEITMPSFPWAKGLEVRITRLAAANQNPFTGQQQILDWSNSVREISVSIQTLSQAQVAAWVTFLQALNGVVNVFRFPAAMAAAFPESLTSDGSTQYYWRLSKNAVGWQIGPGKVYRGITFEARVAI
jgi:hypothetical protein